MESRMSPKPGLIASFVLSYIPLFVEKSLYLTLSSAELTQF